MTTLTATPVYGIARHRMLHACPVKRCPTCHTPGNRDGVDSNPVRTAPDGRHTA